MASNDARRAQCRNGIQNVPIVSVGASDLLLIPCSAKHRPDSLVPALTLRHPSHPRLAPCLHLLLLSLSLFISLFLSRQAPFATPLPSYRFLVFSYPPCTHPALSLPLLHAYARYTRSSVPR